MIEIGPNLTTLLETAGPWIITILLLAVIFR